MAKKKAAKKAAKKPAKGGATKALALTAAQQEKNWKEAVSDLLARRKEMVANVLDYHYDTGLLYATLVEEKTEKLGERKYGNHVVADLATALETSTTTLYYCGRFMSMFTRDQVKALQAKEWPWRQVQQLLSLEDPKDRARFQKDWESGKYGEGGDALREAVSEHNEKQREKGERKDDRGKRAGFMEAAKTAASAITHAGGEILPTFVKAVGEFSKHSEELEDSKREKFTEHAKQLKKVIPVARRQLDAAEKAISKAGI
jgi:hypothetical protein